MPHRPWRPLARDVAKYLRRGWASGFQPVSRLPIGAVAGIIQRSHPRRYPGAVGRHVTQGIACAVAVPDTTVVAPDSASAIAEIVRIQDRRIRAAVTHRSPPCQRHDSSTSEFEDHPPTQRSLPKYRGGALSHFGSLLSRASTAERTRRAMLSPDWSFEVERASTWSCATASALSPYLSTSSSAARWMSASATTKPRPPSCRSRWSACWSPPNLNWKRWR